MWKLLFILTAPLWISALQAERYEITKGRFSLDIPEPQYWRVMQASEFPDSAESMCFPRFRRGNTTLSAGLWEYPPKTIEGQIEAYFTRMNRYASGSYTRELKRTYFRSDSGVEGIRLLVESGKEGGNRWQLIRYVFQNNSGVFVCISANGDSSITDRVVQSLELLPVK